MNHPRMSLWGRKEDSATHDAVWGVIENWRAELSTGDLAELRRGHTVAEVALTGSYAALFYRINDRWVTNETDLSMVAGLLAHLRLEGGGPAGKPATKQGDEKENQDVDIPQPWPSLQLAAHMSRREKGANPPFSELRFRRLLQRRDPDEVYLGLLRVVRLLKRSTFHREVAEAAYHWHQERYRRAFSLAYYENIV